MESKNNIIDMTARRQKQLEAQSGPETGSASILDMAQRRSEILSQERREIKRTILTEFVGASVVIPNEGLAKITLHDISEGGLSFDLSAEAGQFKPGDEVALRVYLNHKTYFGFVCTIASVREVPDENSFRHGGSFVKSSVNDVALYHFVKFIETVSASLHTDNGDVMVSNLNR